MRSIAGGRGYGAIRCIWILRGEWPWVERADRQMQRPIPKGCRGNYTLIGYSPPLAVFFYPATGAMHARVTGDIKLNFVNHKGLHVQAMGLEPISQIDEPGWPALGITSVLPVTQDLVIL